MSRHRPPPPQQWPMPAVVIGCAAAALAVLAGTVAIGTTVAPNARAAVAPVASPVVVEPTLPRAYGPPRPIFAVTATPTRNVDSGTTAREAPRIATSAPRSAETPVPGLPGTPQATTEPPAASEPVATTATTTTTTPTATPAATTAPTTTTPPAPTTEPPTVTTPEITLPEITETTAETTEATP